MANHASHGALPYPVKNARYTVLIPYLDADGDPTDPTTPDTEVSKDGGAFADAAEEATTITGANGMAFITLTGAETDASILGLAAKVASGPKNTLMTLYPRVLPELETGTAQAGGAGSITLAAGAASYDLTGCIVMTTGGTGGGGTGGANNQARIITAYNTSTKVATIVPNWETNPDSTTTYSIKLTENAVAHLLSANAVNATAIASSAITSAKFAAGAIDAAAIANGAIDAATFAAGAIDAAAIANGAIDAATFAAGAIDAAAIATDAIDGDALAASALAEIKTQITDALNVDTYAEIGQETPAATQTIRKMLGYLYKFMRNRATTTSTTISVYNDDATTVGQKSTHSDDGSTYDRGEFTTGP